MLKKNKENEFHGIQEDKIFENSDNLKKPRVVPQESDFENVNKNVPGKDYMVQLHSILDPKIEPQNGENVFSCKQCNISFIDESVCRSHKNACKDSLLNENKIDQKLYTEMEIKEENFGDQDNCDFLQNSERIHGNNSNSFLTESLRKTMLDYIQDKCEKYVMENCNVDTFKVIKYY
eukprot:TRINITY_DN11843_c0_g1_i2.p1 TRINITY_DN11843_c0_g1~~TRINITY_DN11843_c0_g1_i2.p1  ORF type:complete len:177 (-),score=36.46 TRINITY_DN11843_c0_g1_i2:25-555(-)